MRRKLVLLTSVMIIIVISVISIIFYKNNNKKDLYESDEGNIRIVTSFYPVYVLTINLTNNITGIKVDSLTDFSAGCLHDYQLTTNDMKLLSDADVFIINGGGMEEYMDDVLKSYPDLTVINISKGISMLESLEHEGEGNPHVWLDPDLYMKQIDNARYGLENFINNSTVEDNDIIDKINSNAMNYMGKVRDIADEMNRLKDMVKDMTENKNISNKVVVFHDSFAYLANKVGLEVAYSLEIHDDTPLSAGKIAEVVNFINEEKIRYLFTEQHYGDTISDRIMEETKANVYVIDSAVTGDAGKDSYLTAMNKNISTLREAFENND